MLLSLLAQETQFFQLLKKSHVNSCAFTFTYTLTSCFIAQRKVHSLSTPLTAHSTREFIPLQT